MTSGTLVQHASGRATHVMIDDFTDPWRSAEVVLIQPGFARHADFFYHWTALLARRFRVIRRDLPGHGRSKAQVNIPGTPPLSVDVMCDEIADTLDQLNIGRVHFVGESTSGMLGLAFAAMHPDRLHSLTVCATPTYLPPPALELFAFGHKDWPAACRELGSRGWAERLAGVPGTVSGSGDPAYLKWWIDTVAVSSGEGLGQYAEFLSIADSRPYLSKIDVPTLILAPANSAAVSMQASKGLQQQVKGSQLVVVDGPGHEIYKDRAETCASSLIDFIDRVGLAK